MDYLKTETDKEADTAGLVILFGLTDDIRPHKIFLIETFFVVIGKTVILIFSLTPTRLYA